MTKATENPNSNCLDGMSCPQCGDFGPFSLFATQAGRVKVSDDGTDFIEGNVEWEDSSACECLACHHTATVGEFLGKPPVTFDPYQQIVVAAYAHGEFESHTPADIPGCGNSLLKFLLLELSTAGDCQSIEMAIQRLSAAVEALLEVRTAFEAKL